MLAAYEMRVEDRANREAPAPDCRCLSQALEHDTEEGRGCVNALLGSGLVNANGLKGAPRSPLHHLILLRDDL